MSGAGAVDVLVAGGGPAGRALAAACAAAGLRTALADPAPDRPWRATYAAWADELPELPDAVVAARAPGRAIALGEHDLGWDYAVLDTAGLRAALDAGLGGVLVHRGRLVGVEPGFALVDAAGGRGADSGAGAGGGSGSGGAGAASGVRRIPARLVVDATGHTPARRGRVPAEQTAFGVVVPETVATPLLAPGEALFMDWRADHGRARWPTFLYAVPLGGGAVLLEETSLARRPGLPLSELRERLHARLARHGVRVPEGAREERVRFPVDGPLSPSAAAVIRATLIPATRIGAPRDRGPVRPRHLAVGFGAAAPLVHPATGFSVATALTLAAPLADALTSADPHAAARAVVWPPQALAVHALRRTGLEALLRMPPAQVPAFFEAFLGLPAEHRWAYLTGRADLAGTVAAMGALYRRAGWGLRARLVGPALLRRAPATTG